MKYKKNEISEKIEKSYQRPINISIFGMVFWFLFVWYIFLKGVFKSSEPVQIALIEMLVNNWFLILVLHGIAFIIGSSAYKLNKDHWDLTPKYIKWDEEKITIINQRDEKEVIPWNKVRVIRQSTEIDGKEFSGEYILTEITNQFAVPHRVVREDIGNELSRYFLWLQKNHKIPPDDTPFYEKFWFKMLMYAIITILLTLIFFIIFIMPRHPHIPGN